MGINYEKALDMIINCFGLIPAVDNFEECERVSFKFKDRKTPITAKSIIKHFKRKDDGTATGYFYVGELEAYKSKKTELGYYLFDYFYEGDLTEENFMKIFKMVSEQYSVKLDLSEE